MPLYRPIRTTSSAVPDALADVRSEVIALSGATSGQVNGTILKLRDTVDQLAEQVRITPAVFARHAEAVDWVSTSPGTIQVSVAMTVPTGKRRCQVFAGASGMCQSDGIHANNPVFRIDVSSTRSPVLPMIPDNMDSWHLIGQFSADLAVQEGQSLVVSLVLAGGVIFAGKDYIHRASLDAFFAFTA